MSGTVYHFHPSLRQGLAAAITQAAEGQRAAIGVRLHAARRAKASGEWDASVPSFDRNVQLYGPGDVVGFDERMVVRTDPKPDSGNFEPNYFPAIEFADPDFPWRFSPKPAESKGLVPWIVLIVLVGEDRGEGVRREFEPLRRGRNQVPVIKVFSQKKLPNLNHAWRWAHVQATSGQEILSDDELKDLLVTQPDLVVSRLVCPRRLRPATLYTAFLVPAYKLGWAAGLDTPAAIEQAKQASAVELAWDASKDEPIELPYYYRWEFRTSARGDFEFLVRLLEPRALSGLGLREIDCERPGFGLTVERTDVDDAEKKHRLDMEGALQSLDTEYTPWGKDKNGPPAADPPPPIPEPEAFQSRLADELLNRANADMAHVDLPPGFDDTAAIEQLSFELLRDGKSVRFSWTTANNTTGRLEYGPDDAAGGFAYINTGISDYETTNHEVIVVLAPETTYHFRLIITEAGDETITGDATIRVPLPVVAPPIYGRWHAARQDVFADKTHNGWLDVLNLDPRHRAAAGLGSEVVRKQQEALMASAWDQIGAIEAANDVLRRAQFGREGSIFLHDRLRTMALEDFLRTTAPAQKRVIRDNGSGVRRTIPAELDTETRIPAAALAPAFRRMARPRGPVRKRQKTRRMDLLRRLAAGELRSAGPHSAPEGTQRPCEITKGMYQQFVYDAWEANTAGGGTVGSVGRPGASPAVEGGGTVTGGGTGLTPGGEILRDDIPLILHQIPVPENAIRFCDDRITCVQLEGIDDNENLINAVCDAFTRLLRPPVKTTEKPSRAAAFVSHLRDDIHNALDPRVTIRDRTKRRLRLNGDLGQRFAEGAPGDPLDEVMTYPEFPQPMYAPLRDISQALILPGIEKVPQNTIGLLETNGRFLEAYMVALNHELARELLWRRYPTDQRGSYFRQFWDVSEYVGKEDRDPARSELDGHGELKEQIREALKDIRPLHEWGESRLGENDNRRASGMGESLVLVVRGDLLKRYPNAVIYAVNARREDDELLPELPEFGGPEPATLIFPIFRGSLGADLVFMGFPFEDADARSSASNPGKFFVFEERVTEARFGLDSADGSVPEQEDPLQIDDWNNLHWGHFQLAELDKAGKYLDGSATSISGPDKGPDTEIWDENTDAALRAHITLQKPVRLAVHADQMLPVTTKKDSRNEQIS